MPILNPSNESEYGAAHTSVALFDHPTTTVLRVSGHDRATWLHKIVTADVKDLTVGAGARSALLDAKGHFGAVFSVLARHDDLLLIADASLQQNLFDGLRRYIFREKVQLAYVSAEFSVLSLIGTQSTAHIETLFAVSPPPTAWHFANASFDGREMLIIKSDEFSVPAFHLVVTHESRAALKEKFGGNTLSASTIEILRVEAGTPRWGVDIDETTLALEAPNGLNIRVDQGCYVGQEVVARIVHRGHVNRNFVGFVLEKENSANANAKVFDGEKEIGQLTSYVESPTFGHIALGFVRREYTEPDGKRAVESGDEKTRAQIIDLPFALDS